MWMTLPTTKTNSKIKDRCLHMCMTKSIHWSDSLRLKCFLVSSLEILKENSRTFRLDLLSLPLVIKYYEISKPNLKSNSFTLFFVLFVLVKLKKIIYLVIVSKKSNLIYWRDTKVSNRINNMLPQKCWERQNVYCTKTLSRRCGGIDSVVCTLCCCCLVAKLCSTLWDPMDRNLPASSVPGISQARLLEWVAVSSSRGSSLPRDWIQVSWVSCIGRQILYHYMRIYV